MMKRLIIIIMIMVLIISNKYYARWEKMNMPNKWRRRMWKNMEQGNK